MVGCNRSTTSEVEHQFAAFAATMPSPEYEVTELVQLATCQVDAAGAMRVLREVADHQCAYGGKKQSNLQGFCKVCRQLFVCS
jgi:hypothetical protein